LKFFNTQNQTRAPKFNLLNRALLESVEAQCFHVMAYMLLAVLDNGYISVFIAQTFKIMMY